MRTVNPYFLHSLLAPLAGLADDDEAIIRYRDFNPNDEPSVRQVIRELLVPHARTLSGAVRDRVKLAFRYYLTKELSPERDVRLDRVYYSILPPFDAPDDPRQFFLWVWEECFPGEKCHLNDLDNYTEVRDINEPLSM